jgi:hypothetical protein
MVGVSTRSEAQAALFSAIADAVDGKYEPYRALLGEDFSTVRAYQLDLAYAALPVYYRSASAAMLAQLAADGTYDNAGGTVKKAAEAFHKVLIADAAAYAELADEKAGFYNDFYVDEGLVYAADYYAHNGYWKEAVPALPENPIDKYPNAADRFANGAVVPAYKTYVGTWSGQFAGYVNGFAWRKEKLLTYNTPGTLTESGVALAKSIVTVENGYMNVTGVLGNFFFSSSYIFCCCSTTFAHFFFGTSLKVSVRSTIISKESGTLYDTDMSSVSFL